MHPRVASLIVALALTLQPVVTIVCEANCLAPMAAPAATRPPCHHADPSADSVSAAPNPAGSSVQSTTHRGCDHATVAEATRSLRVRALDRPAIADINLLSARTAIVARSSRTPHAPPGIRALHTTVLRV